MNFAGKPPPQAEVIPLFPSPASTPCDLLRRAATDIAERAFANASSYDRDGAFPSSDVAALHSAGLLTAPLPWDLGGQALTGVVLADILRNIGFGSLP